MTLTIPIPEPLNPFVILTNARAAREAFTQAITDQADAIASFTEIINERES